MRLIRRIMGWVFAIASLFFAVGSYSFLVQTAQIQRSYAPSKPWIQLVDAVPVSAVIIFGVAWWRVLKQRPSARGWGIAASLIFLLFSLWAIFFGSESIWGLVGVELALGVVGLIAFSPRPRKRFATDEIRPESIPS